ncbi:hypothetical protein GE09DRAFT_60982 [Coniochaeta sp. 2T2.1]|nr:hypothetical protein GE09DRAFT_60982 [Coniochaeta sp. 2T2.1]
MASLLARLRAAAEQHNIIPETEFAANPMSFATDIDEETPKSPSPTAEGVEADDADGWLFEDELDNADTESDREAMHEIAASASTEMVLYQSRPSSDHAHSDEQAPLDSTALSDLVGRLWSPATASSPEPDQESLHADEMSPPPTSTNPDDIPLEELKVARWARRDSTYKAFPNAKAWQCTVQANRELGINAKIRTSTDYRKEILTEYPLASHQNLFVTSARRSGFVNGRALLNLSLTILTCVGEARPARLYRAIHDKMPHNGIGARGLSLTNTNGLFFQRFLQNHFTWNCRQPSPFLSTSSELRVALNYVFSFEQRRYTGIKLLEISTTGKYWDHHISRLWEVKHILSKLQLRHKDFHKQVSGREPDSEGAYRASL